MTENRPDYETVRGAIMLATRAPSVHNTQPWRWLIGENSVHLMADRTRQVPATDPDGRDLLISCGATLHHLRTALAALGWAAEAHRIPNPADPDHLAALEPRPHVPSEQDIALTAAIPRRRTDRRRFTSWPVPGGHLDLMVRRADRAGAMLVPVTDPSTRYQLTGMIAEATARQEASPAYDAELAMWSGRGHLAADGVPAENSPRRPGSHGDVRMRAFPHGALESTADEMDPDAGQLLVLATRTDDPRSRLRAGEAASAVLLTATDLRLASTPLSQGLEIPDIRDQIRKLVLDDTAFPQLILRVGWSPSSAEPLHPTPRRRLDDVIHFLPGMAPRRNGR